MEGIDFGLFVIRWNGLIIMMGVVLGGALAALEARRRGYDPEFVLELLLPLMLWGTLGARLWHVFTPPLSSIQLGLTTRHYLTHPIDLIAIWIGGLGFPGALIGGAIALFFFCRKHELDFKEWLDILAPAIALGQVVGRAGSLFNQELYGLPTSVPWGIFVNPENRLRGYESVEYYHPLFAYEMVLNFLNLGLIFLASRLFPGRLRNGDLFLLYLFNYGVIRFGLEFVRLDVALINGININQAFMAGVAVLAAVTFFIRLRLSPKL